MTIFVGIDPGASGSIAEFRFFVDTVFVAIPMPKTESDIFHALRFARTIPSESFAVIEAVHSFPGQGVASSFKFGMSYGGLRMALVAAKIPFEAVTPQRWQKAMGIVSKKSETKTQHKNRLKARCQELFPELEVTLATCDAVLLAEYARRLKNGELK